MIAIISTEISGPTPGVHQILEVAVLTATDRFEIKNVSPTYVLYRPPGAPIAKDRYERYSENNLLSETATSIRKAWQIDDLLIERFGRCNKDMFEARAVFSGQHDKLHVSVALPRFYGSLGNNTVSYDTEILNNENHGSKFTKYANPGRALENALIMLSNLKSLSVV